MNIKFLSILLLTLASCLNVARADEGDELISTRNTSLLLLARTGEPLKIAYYGARVSQAEGSQVWWAGDALDRNAYPTFNDNCSAESAIMVQHADGQVMLSLVVQKVERKSVDGGELLTVSTKDKAKPFYVDICYRSYNDADMIETWTEIRHNEKKDIVLKQYASGYLPLRGNDAWLTHFHGQWGNEMGLYEDQLKPGMVVVKDHDGVRNGFSSHGEVMVSLDGKARENEGRVVGAAVCWSGNYKLHFDTGTGDKTLHHLIAGIDETGSDYRLAPGTTFRTPELALTYSVEGKGGVSRNFHNWARHYKLHNGTAMRDVLLNSWEGVYLDITEEKMKKMMDGVKQLGGELFVMDDGWFASAKYNRDRDNAALGDWYVDKRKLPNGIGELVSEAKRNGLKFGIWIEPEMGNWKASELWEKHPEWFLQNTGCEPRLGRGGTQAALDLCNPKVQDFIFGIVDRLMTDNPEIYYIKWDANAEIANYGSPYLGKDRQSQIYVDYHLGLRKVLERIRAKYPKLVIQACASGGGRVTYGVLPYFDEFWTSDDTDALQRVYIQWGTSHFFPSCAMAAHVSASPNHQTGRRIPLKYRFDVAMSGRLGIEMKPSDFNDNELKFAQQAVGEYKRLRDVIQQGDLYRLLSPYEGNGMAASLMYVSPDKQKAVLYAYKLKHFVGHGVPRIYLKGLDPDKRYRLHEINRTDDGMKFADGLVVTGRVLMNAGLDAHLDTEYSSRVLELTAE